MLTAGVEVEWQSASGRDFELLHAIWPLRHVSSAPHHLLLVCSFHSSTRVLSCQGDLTDVTDFTLVHSDQRTIAAAFTPDGSAFIQVTPAGLRVLRVVPGGHGVEGVFAPTAAVAEWSVRALGSRECKVAHAAVEGQWVVLGTVQPTRLVLCQVTVTTTGQCEVAVVAGLPIATDISCLALVSCQGEKASTPALLCAVGGHSSSLDLYSITFSPPSPVGIIPVASAPLAGHRDESSHSAAAEIAVAESCVFVPTRSKSPSPSSLLVVGLREGLLLQFELQPSALSSSLSLKQPVVSRLGSLPVRLCPAASPQCPDALVALSGHLSLLRSTPPSSPLLACCPVADVLDYSYAAHFSTADHPFGSILAVRDARLHVLTLAPPPPSPRCLVSTLSPPFHSATIPLPLSPYRVLWHPPSNAVVVAVDGAGNGALLLVDVTPRRSERGEELGLITGRYDALLDGERVLCMSHAVLPPDAGFLAVGTTVPALRRGVARGRLLLFHLTRRPASSAPPAADEPPVYDFRLMAWVRTRAPVAAMGLHPRGVFCACGSWLVLYGLHSALGGGGELLMWRRLCSAEMRNGVRALDVRGPLVFAAVERDGVSALEVGEEEETREVKLRWLLMDPEPRTADHVLALAAVEGGGRGMQVMRADERGRVEVMRGQMPAATGLPPPPPPPLFDAEAQVHVGHAAVARCRLLRLQSPSPHADVGRAASQEAQAAAQRQQTPTTIIATMAGRVQCIQAVEGSPADRALLTALHRYLRGRVASDLSAGSHDGRRAEAAEMLDGDLLLGLWSCSAEDRSRALRDWRGPGEDELRGAVQRVQGRLLL